MDKTITYQSPYYWHKWFAWRPVVVDTKIDEETGTVSIRKVWLKTILRKRDSSTYDVWWDYRDVQETN